MKLNPGVPADSQRAGMASMHPKTSDGEFDVVRSGFETSLEKQVKGEPTWPPGINEEKARHLLQHGSPAEIRSFLESIRGTPENKAAAKRARMQKLNHKKQQKRIRARRKRTRIASKSRAKNRGRK